MTEILDHSEGADHSGNGFAAIAAFRLRYAPPPGGYGNGG